MPRLVPVGVTGLIAYQLVRFAYLLLCARVLSWLALLARSDALPGRQGGGDRLRTLPVRR